jgi:hypothetical protein
MSWHEQKEEKVDLIIINFYKQWFLFQKYELLWKIKVYLITWMNNSHSANKKEKK